jgi:pantetheine-phosphate adenylyltransferase
LNVAIYPGSFDPLTNGHLDLISRSSILFDKVIVAVSKKSINKNYLFNENERLNLIKKNIQHLDNVSAQVFEGLLINYAKSINANIIIRGLRALSDFESEFQMSLMNRKLNDNINTVFLMPHEKYTYISSSIVKEVFSLKGNVDEYVPKSVLEAMKNKHE